MEKNNQEKSGLIQISIILLLICATVYMLLRTVLVAMADCSFIEKVFGVLFFMAEFFVVIHAFGFFFGIYRLNAKKLSEPKQVELKEFPEVAILIPARHEPAAVLENTVLSCYNLAYPCKKIYILDDSSIDTYKKEAEEIANKYNCELFRRQDRHGAKAGVINDCMKNLTAKYIAVFDVDQNPMGGFLMKTISILEANEKLALVQTPQYYSNSAYNKVAMGANMQQAAFYETVCEAKSNNDAMMCCGTNVVLRKAALDDVGGFDETTVTEDFATAFLLHTKGWKTLYYNHVNTFGLGPEDLGAYLAQQHRWAMGNIAVLKKVTKRALVNPGALSGLQWWEYFVTSSYYLVGWAFLFLILCPVLYIFFDIPSFFMNPVVYVFSFVPYMLLSSYLFYFSMHRRHYGIKDTFRGQLLFFLSLPTYARGAFLGLFGIKRGFAVTAKGGSKKVSYFRLLPQLFLWAVSLMAVTWALNRFMYDHSPAVMVNVIWVMYHLILLSSVFYFNEEWQNA